MSNLDDIRIGSIIKQMEVLNIQDGIYNVKCLDCGEIYNLNFIKLRNLKQCYNCKIMSHIGEKHNMLTIISYNKEKSISSNRIYYNCLCECGNECIISSDHLLRDDTKSCGCLRRNQLKTHGLSGTPISDLYYDMKKRCYNPNCDNHAYYYDKGIRICDEWMGENGLVNFNEWAINNGYVPGLSIERIDRSKNYSPENCKWILKSKQMRNTDINTSIKITDIINRTVLYFSTIIEALEYYGLEHLYSIIQSRLYYKYQGSDKVYISHYIIEYNNDGENPYMDQPIKYDLAIQIKPEEQLINGYKNLPSPIRFMDKKESDK